MILHLAMFTWTDDVTADGCRGAHRRSSGDGRRHPGTAQLSLRREPARCDRATPTTRWRPSSTMRRGLAAYLDSDAHQAVYDRLLGRMIAERSGRAAGYRPDAGMTGDACGGAPRARATCASRSAPIPEPGPGEALVRVTVCGVCGTDAIEFDRGLLLTPPVTLGHEFAGVVEAARRGRRRPRRRGIRGVRRGHLVRQAASPAGEGRTNLCRTYRTAGLQVDGGLAGYVDVPAGILLDVTDSGLPMTRSDSRSRCRSPCTSCAAAALRAGDDAVVVGIGGIGSFITFAAAATGARVIAVDRSTDRLELARSLGAARRHPRRHGIARRRALARSARSNPTCSSRSADRRPAWQAVLGAAHPGAVIVPVGVPEGAGRRSHSAPGRCASTRHRGQRRARVRHDMPEAVRLLASRDGLVRHRARRPPARPARRRCAASRC